MKLLSLLFPFLTSLALLSQGARAELPHVERNFNLMAARDMAGKRLREIIPPERITRIVLLQEHGFANHHDGRKDYDQLVQADYDSLIAHLMASDQLARDLTGDAMERVVATLLVATNDGQLFQVEVLRHLDRGIWAITIQGAGRSARISIEGFQRSEPSK